MPEGLTVHPLGKALVLVPYERLGPFRFGMTHEDVAEVVTGSGLRLSHPTDETDRNARMFHFSGMAVEFGRQGGSFASWEGGVAEHVIAYPPDSPSVIAGGVELRGTWTRMLRDLEAAGHRLVEFENTALLPGQMRVCWDLGLSLQRHDERNHTAEIRAFSDKSFWDFTKGP